MKAQDSIGLALILAVTGACSTYGHAPAGEVSAASVGEQGRRLAAISPPPALAGKLAVNGWAAMAPDSARQGTVVTLSLSDVPAGSAASWSVNRGKCGEDAGVFGSSGAYEAIKADARGRAAATARLPLRTPLTGDYYVSVRAPSTGGEATIACGQFAPPGK